MRYVKYGLYVLAALVIVTGLGLGYIAATFDPNEYKVDITRIVAERTGRTLSIDGDLQLTFFPKVGVTLGGTSTRRAKRHPTLRDNVVVGAGAKVIGDVTVGENAKIGAGSVVVTNVPPNATVVGVPGHIVAFVDPGDDTVLRLPDPEWDIIQELEGRIEELEARLKALEKPKPARRRTAPKAEAKPKPAASE